MLQPIVGFSVESESIIHVTFLSYTYVHLRKLLTVLTRMHVLILDYLVNRYSYNKIYYSSWLPSSKYTDKYILVHVAPSLSGLDIKTLFTMVEKSLVSHAFIMYSKRLFCSFWWMDPSTNFFFIAKIRNNEIVDCFSRWATPVLRVPVR